MHKSRTAAAINPLRLYTKYPDMDGARQREDGAPRSGVPGAKRRVRKAGAPWATDEQNRLIKMEETSTANTAGFPDTEITFKYDYLGRRVEKKEERPKEEEEKEIVDLCRSLELEIGLQEIRVIRDQWDHMIAVENVKTVLNSSEARAQLRTNHWVLGGAIAAPISIFIPFASASLELGTSLVEEDSNTAIAAVNFLGASVDVMDEYPKRFYGSSSAKTPTALRVIRGGAFAANVFTAIEMAETHSSYREQLQAATIERRAAASKLGYSGDRLDYLENQFAAKNCDEVLANADG